MLETKRVVAYGKRPRRIVYVSSDTQSSQYSPLAQGRIDREKTSSTSPVSARIVLSRGRKVHGLSTSPRGSPKSGNILGLASKKSSGNTIVPTPQRRPLGLKSVVLPASPSIKYLEKRIVQTPSTKVAAFSPFLDSDVILTEEHSGENKVRLKKGSRAKTSLMQPTHADKAKDGEVENIRPPRRRALRRAVIVSDSGESEEEDVEATVKIPKRGARANPILISDDSSDDDVTLVPLKPVRNARACHLTEVQPHTARRQTPTPKVPPRRTQADVPTPSLSIQHCAHHIPFPTPIPPKSTRSTRRSHRIAPRLVQTRTRKLSPSTLDLERSFAALSISADIQSDPLPPRTASGPSFGTIAPTPQHLAPLLAECAQATPHCFSTFVQTFPFDDLHGGNISSALAFRKIGEASFSEVFAIGDVVLKIIPLRDESCTLQLDGNVDLPQDSDAKDVLQEVIVTRAMGQVCPGFIKLLRTYVVVGKYPSLLLSLWDEFHSTKPSENIRPHVLPPTQMYALLVLPNGGPDLETYTFPMKAGWRQACSIFWQTAKALATAEDLVSFEHRDLHWGQILVKTADHTKKITSRQPKRGTGAIADHQHHSDIAGISMDHPYHGVTATIIDLGLARMDAKDGNGNDVHWTPFDDIVFEGEGDYQFDVYRMMRGIHDDGAWEQYRPLTNVMWLHYLTLKLLRSKRLRPPGSRSSTATISEFNEKQCYNCLVEIEQLLGHCLSQSKGKKGRRVGIKASFSKAGDVVTFARGRGWVR